MLTINPSSQEPQPRRRRKQAIKNGPQKPAPCRIEPDNIPEDLRQRERWVVWKWVRKEGAKWDKPPFDAKSPSCNASVTDPATWGTFQQALDAYRAGHADGIGIVLSRPTSQHPSLPDDGLVGVDLDDGLVGVDLDDCRDPDTGEVDPWAARELGELDSYAEASPSGTGVKIICRGQKTLAGCKSPYQGGDVEVYDGGRYFTLTGHRLPQYAAAAVNERTEQVAQLWQRVLDARRQQKKKRSAPSSSSSAAACAALGSGSDDEVVVARCQKARNRDKFARLWRGDICGYASNSEADLALCSLLWFHSGGNREQVDRLFRRSPLLRDKWDERHSADGRTYGELTLDRAAEGEIRDPFYYDAQTEAGGPNPDGRESVADVLVRIGEQQLELFHDGDARRSPPRPWTAPTALVARRCCPSPPIWKSGSGGDTTWPRARASRTPASPQL